MGKLQRMTADTPSQPISNTQNNTTSKIPDSERKPKFMDELERLNSDNRYTKQDIIDYVKSRITIKNA